MIDIHPDQARTLAAIVAHGSFEAAAGHLSGHGVGGEPARPRPRSGRRPAGADPDPARRNSPPPARPWCASPGNWTCSPPIWPKSCSPAARPASVRLTLVINSDSLHTWALPGLAAVAGKVQLEILREDQDYSLELLRSGAAAAAITTTAKAAPGCSSRRLGVMRYLPVCTPDFAAPLVSPAARRRTTLAAAPVIVFDRKDDLQDRYLRGVSRKTLQPPRHYVPAAHEFGEAIRWGMGWGLLPEIEVSDELKRRTLVSLDPAAHVDVPLHWQQWRHGSAALDEVAAAVQAAARPLR